MLINIIRFIVIILVSLSTSFTFADTNKGNEHCSSDSISTSCLTNFLKKQKRYNHKCEEYITNYLSSMQNRSDRDALEALANLSDFYIGEIYGEILMQVATEKGPQLLPYLDRKRSSPSSCIGINPIFCHSIKERNSNLDDWTFAILNGFVYIPLGEPDPEKVEAFDIGLMKYLFNTYVKQGNINIKNIDELKKYLWQNYYFRLRIYDPGGNKYKIKIEKDELVVEKKDN